MEHNLSCYAKFRKDPDCGFGSFFPLPVFLRASSEEDTRKKMPSERKEGTEKKEKDTAEIRKEAKKRRGARERKIPVRVKLHFRFFVRQINQTFCLFTLLRLQFVATILASPPRPSSYPLTHRKSEKRKKEGLYISRAKKYLL